MKVLTDEGLSIVAQWTKYCNPVVIKVTEASDGTYTLAEDQKEKIFCTDSTSTLMNIFPHTLLLSGTTNTVGGVSASIINTCIFTFNSILVRGSSKILRYSTLLYDSSNTVMKILYLNISQSAGTINLMVYNLAGTIAQ